MLILTLKYSIYPILCIIRTSLKNPKHQIKPPVTISEKFNINSFKEKFKKIDFGPKRCLTYPFRHNKDFYLKRASPLIKP